MTVETTEDGIRIESGGSVIVLGRDEALELGLFISSNIKRRFLLHWKGSDKPELVEGSGPADAMTRAGYGGGAIAALDYYEELS